MESISEKLEAAETRYEELNSLMGSQDASSDLDELQKMAQEQADIRDLVLQYQKYKGVSASLEDTLAMKTDGDEEMAEMLSEEIEKLQTSKENLWKELKMALIPKDPDDNRDVIVEIRAGAGGDEAALFAGDLYRAYSRYALDRKWHVDILSSHETGIGGFKEIVFEIKGKGVFSKLKYERGVHRVQRVPFTESGGRIHTSTATVAVLPEVDETEVQINMDDLRIDTYRASGAGGQHVNKTSSAIRITHIPTGMVVTCQDERSQLKNKAKALSVLRARMYEQQQQQKADELSENRRSQVGSGDRSEKIRTYNFPQSRVTDHRIGLTVHNLKNIMEGDLDGLFDAMAAAAQPTE